MRTTIFVFILGSSILLGSCNNNQSDLSEETPEALKEQSVIVNRLDDYTSNRGYWDLIEELYKELVQKSENLKQLEEEIKKSAVKSNELLSVLQQFDYKSTSYYESAIQKTKSFSDSLLKKRMQAIIQKSQDHYQKEMKELADLERAVQLGNASINDQHQVLKILLTLPLIEKFQQDKLPDGQKLEEFRKEQEELIRRIESTVPKGKN